MIKSLSAILKSLGKWDYDEIQINNPNNDQALVKVSQCGICSTDVVRSMEVGFYNYPIVPGHEIIGKIYKLGFRCVYSVLKVRSNDSHSLPWFSEARRFYLCNSLVLPFRNCLGGCDAYYCDVCYEWFPF